MKETMLPLDILYHQIQPLMPEMGYILLSHWPKGLYDPPPTSQAVAEAISYPP